MTDHDHDAKTQAQRTLKGRIATNGGHPRRNDLYEHYKGGRYQVEVVGIKEDTLEPMIAYGSLKFGTYSFRTLDNWLEEVEVEGRQVPRFRLVEG